MSKTKGYKLYELGGNVLLNYRNYVKGNESASRALVRRKLTRNIDLAIKLNDNVDGRNTKLYAYGNLHMYVRGNKIMKIKNKRNASDWFYKDEEKYDQLNKLYEIDKYEDVNTYQSNTIQTNTYSDKVEVVVEPELKINFMNTMKSYFAKVFKRSNVITK